MAPPPPTILYMCDMDTLWKQLRSMVASVGTHWLQEQVASLRVATATAAEESLARQARPLECVSPAPSPRAQRHRGSPGMDLPDPPAHALGGILIRGGAPRDGDTALCCLRSLHVRGMAAASPGDVPAGEAAQQRRVRSAASGQSGRVAGDPPHTKVHAFP